MKRLEMLVLSPQDADWIRGRQPALPIRRIRWAGAPSTQRWLVLAVSIVLGMLAMLWALAALAAGEAGQETWVGQTRDKQDRALTVRWTQRTKDKAELRYGPPRQCTLTAASVGPEGLRYDLVNSNGGYCDTVLGGALELAPIDNAGARKASVFNSKNEAADSFTLTRDTAP